MNAAPVTVTTAALPNCFWRKARFRETTRTVSPKTFEALSSVRETAVTPVRFAFAKCKADDCLGGAKTVSITTHSIMTISIMTLSITTLSITTLSIVTLSIMTLSITTLSITTLSIMTLSITILSITTFSAKGL